jgi:uncharacterized protein (TIGR03435 family)
MLRLSLVATLLLLTVPGLHAQTGTPPSPTFDVASLKASKPTPPFSIDLGNTLNGKVTLTNVTLSDCLKFAFNVRNDSQISGPDWIKSRSDLFTIVGQAPPDTPKDQLRLMTRTLLVERFRLAFHREQRELPFLALVVDKKGLKLHESQSGADTSSSNVRSGRIVANVSMGTLAAFLARFTQSNVVDLTELKGAYEVHLEWIPENLNAPKSSDSTQPDDPAAGSSIFSALTDQLGLRLESRKGPIDVVVIEHAEHTPLGN